MNKKKLYIVILIIIVIGVFFVFKNYKEKNVEIVVPKDSSQDLTGKWVWVYTELLNGKRFEAPDGEKFAIEFGENGEVSGTTDCNSIHTTYKKDGQNLSFDNIISTKKFCEGSVEDEYKEQLMLTDSYVINEDGLFLNLSKDFETMVFIRK